MDCVAVLVAFDHSDAALSAMDELLATTLAQLVLP